MSECNNKCEECSIEKITDEISKCGFHCDGGPLETHRGYLALLAKAAKTEQRLLTTPVCSYCGKKWPKNEGDVKDIPSDIAEDVRTHMDSCPDNPMVKTIAELEAANAELKEKLALTRCELSYLKAGKTMAVQILHRHGGMVLVTTEELRSMITQIAEYEVIWDPEEGERIAEVRRQLENMLKGSH